MSPETRPTERREGGRVDPARVACPRCGYEGTTTHEVNVCSECGRWFEVEP